MKIWEAIEEIVKDRTKEFISTCEEVLYYDEEQMKIAMKQEEGYRYEVNITLNDDNVLDDWQPVEKSVSFLEAVKSGKRVKLINKYHEKLSESDDYVSLDSLLINLGNSFYTEVIRKILLGDNFVVEEEE